MRILLTNDDGHEAPGLMAARKALRSAGHEVVVVAPEFESSAVGHGISLHRPLRIRKRGEDLFSIDGTPTDCVNLAVFEVLESIPDMLVAGVNQGPNMGTDTLYSGTVACAMEGAILGIASIAVSYASYEPGDFGPSAEFTARLASIIGENGLPEDVYLNVNVPPGATGPDFRWRMTVLGKRRYSKMIKEGVDPRGKKYYWIGGDPVELDSRPRCDTRAVEEGIISVTPLRLDHTAHEHVGEIGRVVSLPGRQEP